VAKQSLPKTDFIATRESKSYAIAIDPSGKINWKSNHIDSDHIIAVLTEQVTSDYLAFLQSKKVSYLFGGKAKIDLGKVLEKLTKEFKIKKLLLEGGGKINGAMLPAHLGNVVGIWAALSFWSCFRFAAVTALSRVAIRDEISFSSTSRYSGLFTSSS
jgi:2,5-diamino-6-(ribosylamino)-4(3H)-pyrimidinone 5'-phosphate reductase